MNCLLSLIAKYPQSPSNTATEEFSVLPSIAISNWKPKAAKAFYGEQRESRGLLLPDEHTASWSSSLATYFPFFQSLSTAFFCFRYEC